MRIVDRRTFLALPEGTLYCKTTPIRKEDKEGLGFNKNVIGDYDNLAIKGETIYGDWYYEDLSLWIACNDSSEYTDLWIKMSNDSNFECKAERSSSRDGFFDEDETFIVFNISEMNMIIALLQESVKKLEENK